jgi:DNA invertase Pin-like site-specific DNA recombinase
MNDSTTRAALYLRVSLDATGEGLAVDRQRDDCKRIAEARGWQVVAEYVDNSISATDARKSRPGYDALVTAYEAGEFDALLCWDLDRLTRQPRQLEDWIDRALGKDLKLVTANGEADLTTDGGRQYARIKLAVARGEVERKSARQKSAARQRSDRGKPPLGVRLTGYTPNGKLVHDEAEVIRGVFKRFLAGESLRGITRWLAEEGVSTRHGRPWNPSSVRTLLTNPRYAGQAVYQGQTTGKRGAWTALVTEEEFAIVQGQLADPRRKTARTGTDRRHLGAGLFRCGTCGEAMRSWSGNRYRCKNGCFARTMGPIDVLVEGVMVERLSRPDLSDLLPSQPDSGPLATEVKQLRDRLETVEADYDAGHIDGPRYATARAKVLAQLEDRERRLAARSVGRVASSLLGSRDPAGEFRAASLMQKRAAIDALLTVTLHPGVHGSRSFDPDSVVVAWKGQS